MNTKSTLDLIEAVIRQSFPDVAVVRVPGGIALMQVNGGHLFVSVRPVELAMTE